jgi:hypothetical protein
MRGYQFSLRMLLAAVAVAGIGAALWTAKPSWKVGAIEALLLVWVPTSAIVMVINSTGMSKTFWIGTSAECLAASLGFIRYAVPVESYSTYSVMLQYLAYHISDRFWSVLLAWAVAPIVGFLCVATHWLLVRPLESKH